MARILQLIGAMSSMLATIGRKGFDERLVSSLLECHERLRQHLRLAVVLGSRSDVGADEVIEACQRCERYAARRAEVLAAVEQLAQGFEEHLRKEEEIIFPAIDVLPSIEEQARAVAELCDRRNGVSAQR